MIPTHTLLNLLRNPHGHGEDELRAARLQAADMIEAAEAAKPRPGTFEARRLHVGRLRRRQREVQCPMPRISTRTARATTLRRTVERHARWHDERHGNVQ